MARPKTKTAVVDNGHFIRTYSGAKFFFGDMSKNDFNIREIATHLARTPRFSGATKHTYSVCQHSLAVAQQMMRETDRNFIAGMIGLLHDAHEAFIGDINTPLKRHMLDAGFDFNKVIAGPIDDWIYGLHHIEESRWPDLHRRLHAVDSEMGTMEGLALVRGCQAPEGFTPSFPFTPSHISPEFAERQFVALYQTLRPHMPRG